MTATAHESRRRISRLRAFALAAGLLLMIVLVQWLAFRLVAPILSADDYAERAVDLRVGDRWRWGYSHGYHGATFVRTRNLGQLTGAMKEGEPEVEAAMQVLLDRLYRRAVFEGLFYLAWSLGFLWLLPRVWRAFVPGSAGHQRRAVTCGGLCTLAALVFLLPFWGWNYGGAAFSNLEGPYPRSWSTGYPRWSGLTFDTVSYRPAVELVLLPGFSALRTLPDVWLSPHLPRWIGDLWLGLSSSLLPDDISGFTYFWTSQVLVFLVGGYVFWWVGLAARGAMLAFRVRVEAGRGRA